MAALVALSRLLLSDQLIIDTKNRYNEWENTTVDNKMNKNDGNDCRRTQSKPNATEHQLFIRPLRKAEQWVASVGQCRWLWAGSHVVGCPAECTVSGRHSRQRCLRLKWPQIQCQNQWRCDSAKKQFSLRSHSLSFCWLCAIAWASDASHAVLATA